jgi:branched-chain amino acid transport system substrate-binding protein
VLLASQRPDVRIVGDELHPMGRVKDFLPYAAKIKASGAQAVLTGNWGNDLTLLVQGPGRVGFEGKFYTFYGNALGAPAAIGEAGVGRCWRWPSGTPTPAARPSRRLLRRLPPPLPRSARRLRAPAHAGDGEMLAEAIERSGSTEAAGGGARLEGRALAGAALAAWQGP